MTRPLTTSACWSAAWSGSGSVWSCTAAPWRGPPSWRRQEGGEPGPRGHDAAGADDYADDGETVRLMDPDAAAAAVLVDDDDISLWTTDGLENGDGDEYRDSEEEGAGFTNGHGKFVDEEATIGLQNGTTRK